MSLLLPNAFRHSYPLCWSTVFSSLDVHCCCLISFFGRDIKLSGGSVSCDLWHRRKVASPSVFFKIDSLVDHPVRGLFPAQYALRRPTRGALAAHSRSFEMPRARTVQFSRSFVLSCVRLWNMLDESVFVGDGFGAFNPLVPSAANMRRNAKILILILEGITKKFFHERRHYESVDEKKLILVNVPKNYEKKFRQ